MDSKTRPRPLRARWLVAGLVAAVAAGGAAAFAATRPSHPPTAAVLVSTTSSTHLVAGAQFMSQAAASFADVAKRPLVLDPVIAELGLHVTAGQLAQRVDASVEKDTSVIEISASGSDRAESARIANAVSRHLIDVSSSLTPSDTNAELTLVQVTAAVPTDG